MTLVEDSRWDVFKSEKMTHDGSIDYEFQVLHTEGDVLSQNQYELYTTDKSAFYDPEAFFLEMEFNTTLGNDTTVVGGNDTSPLLASNAFLAFEDIRYYVGNNLVQMVRKPGLHVHMNLATDASKEYLDTIASNAYIFVDGRSDTGDPAASTHANLATDPAYARRLARQLATPSGVGYQKAFLPLRLAVESLNSDKVIQGSEIRFVFNKVSQVNEALYGSAVDGAKLNIKSLRLWGSKVKPNPALYSKFLEEAKKSSAVTRMMVVPDLHYTGRTSVSGTTETWQVDANSSRPVKVILGFQWANRATDPKLNPLEFDTLGATKSAINLNTVTLKVNGQRVPAARPYNPAVDGSARIVQEIYRSGGMDTQTLGSSIVTTENWLNQHSLFVFDLSNIEGSPFEKVERAQIEVEWGCSAAVARAYRILAEVFALKEYEYSYATGTTIISLK